jgi:hypothetical protein
MFDRVDREGTMLRKRFVHRLTGLFVRWGMLKHPYGREYARERYSVTGRRVPEIEATERTGTASLGARAALVGTVMLLLSLLAAGVLYATA